MAETEVKDIQKIIITIAAIIAVIVALVFIYMYYSNHNMVETKTSCKDVTSYDYNWDNDVLCTRSNGTTFYTDYAGGYKNDPEFEKD